MSLGPSPVSYLDAQNLISKPSLDALLREIEDFGFTPSAVSDYRLHAAASNTFAVKRIPTCSKYPAPSGARLVKSGQASRFYGFTRCKANQMCPICHTVWLREQRRKLTRLLAHWPGQVSAITLTIDHQRTATTADVLQKLQAVRRNFVASRAYRAPWIAGVVLRVEVSLGDGGWHPHIHGMLFSANKPTKDQLASLLSAWREAARVEGCRVGKHAGKAELLADKNAALKAGAYLCKRGSTSPFALLGLIAESTASAAVIESAKSLWRDYCRGVCANTGLRFVTTAGVEIKNSWSAYSAVARTSESALARIERYVQQWDGPRGTGELYELAGRFLATVAAEVSASRYDVETRHRIAMLKDALADAIELRDELGYYGDLDPLGDVDEIAEELYQLLGTTKPRISALPGLATFTPLGASLLTAGYKTALAKAKTHGEVRTIFERLIASLETPVEPSDLYALNYDNQEIVSMYLPSIDPPPKGAS